MAIKPEIQATIIKVASDWALAHTNHLMANPKPKRASYPSIVKRNFISVYKHLHDWAENQEDLTTL